MNQPLCFTGQLDSDAHYIVIIININYLYSQFYAKSGVQKLNLLCHAVKNRSLSKYC